MNLDRIACGFVPLVDCAPLVVARELGFAAEEGIDLELQKQPSWSAIRDKLVFGDLHAAHMLSVLPVAMSMGLGGAAARIDALSVLSVNGDVVGVDPALAARMQAAGVDRSVDQATAVGRALISAAGGPLRIGVPFPFSMHAELLYYWLSALGLEAPRDLDVRTVPPPRMAEAIAAGEIDAFCVGEPWGSVAVDLGAAEIVLPGAAIWQFAPEKVLAVRHDWTRTHTGCAMRLIRAVWRAARWLGEADNRLTVSDLLARPEYLDRPAEIIDRALSGHLILAKDARPVRVPRFLEFFDCAATFPWRSQAVWMARRWSARAGVEREAAKAAARACYRADLYRTALQSIGADVPGASEKVEGALSVRTEVASSKGEMFLGPDRFFDGAIFDPSTA
ncbi:MAG: CmpA/NrtA family ABC transporter substrate-binding protein [Pseudomonadota bacterium]